MKRFVEEPGGREGLQQGLSCRLFDFAQLEQLRSEQSHHGSMGFIEPIPMFFGPIGVLVFG